MIIEDDYFSAKRLKKLIMEIDDTLDIHGPLKSVNEVVEELTVSNDYDLIFSDIRLVDGDEFDAFRKVMPSSFVIFTTAYDEYAMPAIKNNGVDYLMKPIDIDDLRAAIDRLQSLIPAQQEDSYHRLSGVLRDTHRYKERFLVSRGDELIMLYTDDISHISKDDNHVKLVTEDGISYSLPISMTEVEEELDPERFFRLTRQYIANIKGIKKISFSSNSRLLVKSKVVMMRIS